MINTCYTTTTADADWIFIDCQVQEDKWDQFMDIRDDVVLIQEAIDQGWIVRTEGL